MMKIRGGGGKFFFDVQGRIHCSENITGVETSMGAPMN